MDSPPSLADKVSEVEREIETRKRVYPKWVEAGKITQPTAMRRLEILQSILDDYRKSQEIAESRRASDCALLHTQGGACLMADGQMWFLTLDEIRQLVRDGEEVLRLHGTS